MRRTRASLAALAVAAFSSLALFAATASATFEATMAARQASARAAGPTFVIEAGGGRRTRIRDFSLGAGSCGSIYSPLLNITKASRGFVNGNGAAVFGTSAQDLHLKLELRVKPRGEGLSATGLFKATVGTCHERVRLDLVSTTIRGGGRHASG
ncbi:MAG TPA: hypothetical protein VHZ54_06890 [Solirubrobacterales bacterium]|nr:hypothetical protein [Solirubrobacterales bacterium]